MLFWMSVPLENVYPMPKALGLNGDPGPTISSGSYYSERLRYVLADSVHTQAKQKCICLRFS